MCYPSPSLSHSLKLIEPLLSISPSISFSLSLSFSLFLSLFRSLFLSLFLYLHFPISYHSLSSLLIPLFIPLSSPGHYDEALAVAERGRTRAFADLLVERQQGHQPLTSDPYTPTPDPYSPVTVEHILNTVNSQKSLVLYFSLAAGYLYSWLLAPGTGRYLHTETHTHIYTHL